ncbi:MAG: DUF4340 domain-containing protein [Chromatiaceae bacterium]|nr:DUF4340 domain-containing protein [Chromatiaceae bacterium]
MTPLMRNLTVLLIVQLLLALWLFSSSDTEIDTQPLLPQLSAADSLQLSSEDGELTLTKQGDNWQLANGLPVSEGKLDGLLRDLTVLKSGWPVAQSSEAQRRFSVADDKFEQKLVLMQGEKELHTLYLGDSPAFRQLYVRTDGDEAIYKAALNRFELSLEESAWLDKQLLRLPVVERIAQGDNSLSRQGDNWQLSLNGESHSADSAAARDLVAKLSSLSVLKRAEKAPLSSEITELNVRSSARDYQYQLVKQDDTALIRRNDIEHWFELSQSQFEQLSSPDWTALIQAEGDSAIAVNDAAAEQNPPASGD